MSDCDVVQMGELMAWEQQPEDTVVIYKMSPKTKSDVICPKCGGEVLINKPSGNGFCIYCDYTVSGKKDKDV